MGSKWKSDYTAPDGSSHHLDNSFFKANAVDLGSKGYPWRFKIMTLPKGNHKIAAYKGDDDKDVRITIREFCEDPTINCSYLDSGCIRGVCDAVQDECVARQDDAVCDDGDWGTRDRCEVTGLCTHLDFLPPEITMWSPQLEAAQSDANFQISGPDGVDFLYTFSGAIQENEALAEAWIEVNGERTDLSGGDFSETLALRYDRTLASNLNTVALYARDAGGNEAALNFTLEAIPPYDARYLSVRFRWDVQQSEIDQLIDVLDAARADVRPLDRQYLLRLPEGSDVKGTLEDLSRSLLVYYANLEHYMMTAGIALPIDDMYYYGNSDPITKARSTWFLRNEDIYPISVFYDDSQDRCNVANGEWFCPRNPSMGCELEQEYGILMMCSCESDTSCQDGEKCLQMREESWPKVCAKVGSPEHDIGWSDAMDDIVQISEAGEAAEVVVAVLENGFPRFWHRELAGSAWTNTLECCGISEGTCPHEEHELPTCTAGEGVYHAAGYEPRSCESDAECQQDGASYRCIQIPYMKRCLSNLINTVCESSANCAGGDCEYVGGVGTCSDNCPGLCGVDDDEDGRADYLDPEVMSLRERLLKNRLDDDFDSQIDEADEADLATWDDDEDGYIDDMHGVNMFGQKMAEFGANTNFTLNEHGTPYMFDRGGSCHTTRVAAIFAAAIDNVGPEDNGGYAPGIHPRIKFISIGAYLQNDLGSARDYAASKGAKLLNLSALSKASFLQEPTTTDLRSYMKAWRDSFHPNLIQVSSAGNDAWDLNNMTTMPDDQGLFKFLYPQQCTFLFDDHHFLAGNHVVPTGTKESDEYIEEFNYGKDYVAFGAPGQGMGAYGGCSGEVGNPEDNFITYFGGTSASAPVIVGSMALALSKFPELRNDSASLLYRVIQTLDYPAGYPDNIEMSDPLATLIDRVRYPGRISVANLLNEEDYPLTLVDAAYADRSDLLQTNYAENTMDIKLIDLEDDGLVDMMLQVFGAVDTDGNVIENRLPRLHRIDPATFEFQDITYGPDGQPGGDTDRLPSSLVGNYFKVAVGRLNNDPCVDLVFASHGGLNKMAFQIVLSGVCTGYFEDRSDMLPSSTQNRYTTDVRLADFDLGSNNSLDIFFMNKHVDGMGDQLIRNLGGLLFLDVSDKLPSERVSSMLREPEGATFCDLDLDGYPDLVMTATAESPTVTYPVWMNVSDSLSERKFVPNPDAFDEPYVPAITHDVICADLTGDGYPELLFARRRIPRKAALKEGYDYGYTPYLFINKADGTFTNRTDLLPYSTHALLGAGRSVNVCDLDGDGKMEILLGNGHYTSKKVDSVRILEGDTTSGYIEQSGFHGIVPDIYDDINSTVVCADLDGNGTVDGVIVANMGSKNRLWLKRVMIP
ncbi:MAG: hypothetical protein C4523_11220 [Myxococcales bacterium]|nr:MAG: hypothetical protein C4523_11220 [Myxococcales bacterium]